MKKKNMVIAIVLSAAFGAAAMGAAVVLLMPGMMIVQTPSPHNFEDTVARIEAAIADQGWVHSETMDMNKSMAKHGVEFAPRVQVIKLCKPEYAEKILTSDRYLSCLMPCAIAVYETDQGVMISKMNTGLMGKLFGGAVAEVMGGAVSKDEAAMLKQALAG